MTHAYVQANLRIYYTYILSHTADKSESGTYYVTS